MLVVVVLGTVVVVYAYVGVIVVVVGVVVVVVVVVGASILNANSTIDLNKSRNFRQTFFKIHIPKIDNNNNNKTV